MHDHVHMMISIPPKNTVLQVVGHMKDKNVIHLTGCMASANEVLLGELMDDRMFCIDGWLR